MRTVNALIPCLFLIVFFCACAQQQKKDVTNIDSAKNRVTNRKSTKENKVLPNKIISKADNSEMLLIPCGEFIYGISKIRRDSILRVIKFHDMRIFATEYRPIIIKLHSYYIDKYEITNAQYNRFIKATGHHAARYSDVSVLNKPDQPVVGIGWDDAAAYAKWSGKRLPDEQEWEKAARGTDGRIWPWGNYPSEENYNGASQGYYAPIKVGSFPKGASPYGVMDMAGNVFEFTSGIWQGSHTMRGGSYLNDASLTRTTIRWAAEREKTGTRWLGFRCVMDTNFIATYSSPK